MQQAAKEKRDNYKGILMVKNNPFDFTVLAMSTAGGRGQEVKRLVNILALAINEHKGWPIADAISYCYLRLTTTVLLNVGRLLHHARSNHHLALSKSFSS